MSCRIEYVDIKSRPELMGEPLGHTPNSIFLIWFAESTFFFLASHMMKHLCVSQVNH